MTDDSRKKASPSKFGNAIATVVVVCGLTGCATDIAARVPSGTLCPIEYPPDAERRGVEGTVVVSIALDDHGQIVQIKVRSRPDPELTRAALIAMRDCARFRPAVGIDGKPKPFVIHNYRYNFVIPR